MNLKLLKIIRFFHLINKKNYNEKRQIEIVKNSPLFDAKWYLAQNPDVKAKKIGAAKHYVKYGWKEGRNPSPDFDTEEYLAEYPELEEKNWCPLFHYILEHKELRPITKKIDVLDVCKIKKKYFFSIIVASYNYQDYIKETLDSLVKQTYKNFEVIVVDDGSKDESVKVIKEYTRKYPFVHLYQHENGENKGLPATVYLGVLKAQGEYIAFCESDDYWDIKHLEYLNKKINEKPQAQIIVNDVKTIGDSLRCQEMERVINYRKNIIIKQNGKIADEQFSNCNYIVTFSACCVQKKILTTCNFLDVPKKTALDWWLWRQICYNNIIYYIDKKLTFWRLHNSYNIRNIESEQQKHEDFLLKLNHQMEKRKYNSVYQNNGRLADINQITILQNYEKKKQIIQKINTHDLCGIKICYISTTGQKNRPIGDGSTRYRCYHPAETLTKAGAFVTIVPHSTFIKNLSYEYDIYIFHRPCSEEEKIIEALKKIGKILMADYDDLIFGNQNVAIQSSIYKNLKISLKNVTQIFQNNLNALLLFDYISVSTEKLKEEVLAIHPEAQVFVIHNFIPESIFSLSQKLKLRQQPKDKDMLMYCTGTLSHNLDFKEIEETLLNCLEKDLKLKLVIFGVLSASPKLIKTSRVFFHDAVNYWDMLNAMSISAFTIAPLEENSRFNECKSNVKFLESSMAGATLFATPIEDMRRVENASIQLCKTKTEWENIILNRSDLNIQENITNNFQYIKTHCASITFLNEFKEVFKNMEI